MNAVSPRLDRAALSALPRAVRPAVDPAALRPRVVHLGLGAFHRAHQALYTEDAEAAHGGGWGIAAVAQRSTAVLDALRPQDCLYTCTRRDPGGPATRVVAAVTEALHATADADRLRALLASPDVTVVTLTVTEKGYRRDPVHHGLDLDDPAVRADLAGAGPPETAVGQLAVGLRARYAAGGPPLSVLSCDNMTGNSTVLARLVRDHVTAAGWPEHARLLEWLETSVAFPRTMVDRIVPAPTEADRDTAARALGGRRDEAAVAAEPFTQWVIEDAFTADRPRWEAAGAQLVADVAPYELTKLRLLNGSHSLLAHRGLAAGLDTVADVLDTAWGERAVRDYATEVAATLPAAPGLDTGAYVNSLVERFANHAMGHRLRQIASDGSLKIPERWLAPLRELRSAGRPAPALTGCLAAYARHTRAAPLDDPSATALRAAWDAGTPADAVRRLLTVLGAADLADDAELAADVAAGVRELDRGA
ncbi:mannitol dehydrogenase family protein [Streptomyces sp. SL13]|uniref:Mannitol-1-phosphate 5-dehydrogenase n=1 Tax=Streptantibioticus silvisoli TaxID=2705255 RepID=A0AA90KFE1_9ACTN|nr:mannitol dehydrogenase family protein [Streptantibioticus silvisoli]MDI5969165.1 mannitol dehydrogenase family protein [Streptantibioticus silvisoli]